MLSRIASGQRTPMGAELVKCLTWDAAELAPYLADLSVARAEALVTQAASQGGGPWLRDRLIAQQLFNALPAAVRDNLDAQYFDNTARMAARYHELGVILERLAEQRIPVIALKGIYLAKAVYPQPGLRPMSDMDLLFRAADLEASQTLLLQLGYTQKGVARPLADALPNMQHLPPFERPGATNIEVHLRIEGPSAPFSIDYDGVWERARPWPLGGRPLLALAPEDLLLHLCLHATYHHRFRIGLNALLDISRVAQVEPLDWDLFIERAGNWGAELPSFLGLSLAQRLVRASIPGAALAALAPREPVDAILAIAARTILDERVEDRSHDALKDALVSRHNYLKMLDELNAMSSWRAKLGFILAKAFPSRTVLESPYPRFEGSGWVRVMYGMHWLVLAGRFARRMGRAKRYWQTLRELDPRWFS
ncbi:MAG: nucleotidyltransferase family protein [Candidatus Competibacteraceae bacterium]